MRGTIITLLFKKTHSPQCVLCIVVVKRSKIIFPLKICLFLCSKKIGEPKKSCQLHILRVTMMLSESTSCLRPSNRRSIHCGYFLTLKTRLGFNIQPAKKRYTHCPLYEAKKGYLESRLNTLKVLECCFLSIFPIDIALGFQKSYYSLP